MAVLLLAEVTDGALNRDATAKAVTAAVAEARVGTNVVAVMNAVRAGRRGIRRRSSVSRSSRVRKRGKLWPSKFAPPGAPTSSCTWRARGGGARDGRGRGAAMGGHLSERGRRPRHLDVSLLAAAWRLGLPATVHVAVGTDIVHIHTHGCVVTSLSIPMAHMRRNFRGSISANPVAGQPEAQAPQVRQGVKFPPSGMISLTLSIEELCFFPLILMVLSDIDLFLFAYPTTHCWGCSKTPHQHYSTVV